MYTENIFRERYIISVGIIEKNNFYRNWSVFSRISKSHIKLKKFREHKRGTRVYNTCEPNIIKYNTVQSLNTIQYFKYNVFYNLWPITSILRYNYVTITQCPPFWYSMKT